MPDEHDSASQLDEMFRVLRGQQDTITGLLERLSDQDARLAELSRRLDARPPLATADDPQVPNPSIVDWYALTEPERGRLLGRLDEFVGELTTRYGPQDSLRPCWWRHEPVREELMALLQARDFAYAKTSEGSVPSWWLDTLERGQNRLRRLFVHCRKGHQERDADNWMPDDERLELNRMIAKLKASQPVDEGTTGRDQHGHGHE